MGLRSDRPFVLWVHSALSPTPEPPEPQLVHAVIDALRAHPDPRLRRAGRAGAPAPGTAEGVGRHQSRRYDNVAFHGREPDRSRFTRRLLRVAVPTAAPSPGLATSAFLEAAIVGRPVLTFTLPEYRMHQEEMIHFRYLMTVAGGLLHMAPDLETHFPQLVEAVALGGARDERNRRFLAAFIRPAGLDVPATPAVATAIEQVAVTVPSRTRRLRAARWMRPVAMALAVRSRTGVRPMADERPPCRRLGRARGCHRADGRGAYQGQGGLAAPQGAPEGAAVTGAIWRWRSASASSTPGVGRGTARPSPCTAPCT